MDEAEIRAYMERYMASWNKADLPSILAAYHTPCFVHKRGIAHVNIDETAKRRYFAALVDGTTHELTAGARWEMPQFEVIRLGRDNALATVRWVFRRTDGTTVEDYLDSYVFAQIDGAWGFLGDIVHS